MIRERVIIDCDPGQDDAIALMLAFASSELEILGVTTVAGNVQLAKTQRNARLICELLGQNNMKVFAGCPRPMFRELITAEEYHGANGLNGISLNKPRLQLQTQHAVSFITETLEQNADASISLVLIGPLTNLSTAIIQAPHIIPKIKQIVLMGGSARELGNVTPAAEFNIYVDPHAADVVLRCGRPITIAGLDATHQARVNQIWRTRIDQLEPSNATNLLKVSVAYFAQAYLNIYGQDEPPIHDVLAVAYLVCPELFKSSLVNVAIETTSPLTLGATVVDVWGFSGNAPNAHWITDVDRDSLFEMLIQRLSVLP